MRRVFDADIDGDPAAIYRLVAEVESWSGLFPHVIAADVLWREGQSVVARVRASRHGLPVTWTCRLDADADAGRVAIVHLGGFAHGLCGVWTFDQIANFRARVRLTVSYQTSWPARDRLLARLVIDDLATRTLAMVKLLAEADRAARAGWTQE